MKEYELITRAKLSLKIKDYEQAILYLNRALKENPDSPNLLILLGNTYQSLKEYDRAIESYTLAIKNKNS